MKKVLVPLLIISLLIGGLWYGNTRYGWFGGRDEVTNGNMEVAKFEGQPPETDLSYLTVQTDDGVNMLVTDEVGHIASKVGNTFERSFFEFEEPIGGYNDTDATSGTGGWTFEYKYPESGTYEILLKSEKPINSEVWIFAVDKEGDRFISKDAYDITPEGLLLKLYYDNTDASITSIK